MKKTVLFLFSILLCAALRAQEQEFVIRGVIPGMADGIRVALLSAEGLSHETLAETEAKDGRFELRGKVDSPLLCTLVTNNLGILSEEEMNAGASIRWTYTPVFVDNVVMTVETPHYDSIPVELPVSASFRITGGEIQADFNEYNLMEQTPGKDKRWEFILSHPHSAVSAYLGNQLMRQGYNLTVQEVKRLQQAIDSVPADPQRFALFQKNCEYALQTARNHPLVDLELVPAWRLSRILSSWRNVIRTILLWLACRVTRIWKLGKLPLRRRAPVGSNMCSRSRGIRISWKSIN